MKIESVDLFYFALPHIKDQADGSQDIFIVRVRSDTGLEGVVESDASPFVSIASFVTPKSHSVLVNINEHLIGQTLDEPADVPRIWKEVEYHSMDIAQLPHAYAAADIALWDLLGRHLNQPVYELLGATRAHPKRAYASVLFEDTPEQTEALARQCVEAGYTAAKFGWGPMGRRGEDYDIALVRHARKGLGDDAALMIDAGTIWGGDWQTALKRAEAFAEFNPTWLEEPLHREDVPAYAKLCAKSPVPIAGGEGANRVREAEDLLTNGGVSFLQIDPGRIGGITPSVRTFELTNEHGAVWVNHTYKSRISLAAAMCVHVGDERHPWLEYCESGSDLLEKLVDTPIGIDAQGMVTLPATPGIGVTPSLGKAREYAKRVTMTVDGRTVGASCETF